jgi:hypothetical protein
MEHEAEREAAHEAEATTIKAKANEDSMALKDKAHLATSATGAVKFIAQRNRKATEQQAIFGKT